MNFYMNWQLHYTYFTGSMNLKILKFFIETTRNSYTIDSRGSPDGSGEPGSSVHGITEDRT